MDTHPLTTPQDILTDCLNGTLITYNGNEFVLQNDMGNVALQEVNLSKGFVPVSCTEHNGIVYILSYNPVTKTSELGSYPSPADYTKNGNFFNYAVSKFDLNLNDSDGNLKSEIVVSELDWPVLFYGQDKNLVVNPRDSYHITLSEELPPYVSIQFYTVKEGALTPINNIKYDVGESTEYHRFPINYASLLAFRYDLFQFDQFDVRHNKSTSNAENLKFEWTLSSNNWLLDNFRYFIKIEPTLEGNNVESKNLYSTLNPIENITSSYEELYNVNNKFIGKSQFGFDKKYIADDMYSYLPELNFSEIFGDTYVDGTIWFDDFTNGYDKLKIKCTPIILYNGQKIIYDNFQKEFTFSLTDVDSNNNPLTLYQYSLYDTTTNDLVQLDEYYEELSTQDIYINIIADFKLNVIKEQIGSEIEINSAQISVARVYRATAEDTGTIIKLSTQNDINTLDVDHTNVMSVDEEAGIIHTSIWINNLAKESIFALKYSFGNTKTNITADVLLNDIKLNSESIAYKNEAVLIKNTDTIIDLDLTINKPTQINVEAISSKPIIYSPIDIAESGNVSIPISDFGVYNIYDASNKFIDRFTVSMNLDNSSINFNLHGGLCYYYDNTVNNVIWYNQESSKIRIEASNLTASNFSYQYSFDNKKYNSVGLTSSLIDISNQPWLFIRYYSGTSIIRTDKFKIVRKTLGVSGPTTSLYKKELPLISSVLFNRIDKTTNKFFHLLGFNEWAKDIVNDLLSESNITCSIKSDYELKFNNTNNIYRQFHKDDPNWASLYDYNLTGKDIENGVVKRSESPGYSKEQTKTLSLDYTHIRSMALLSKMGIWRSSKCSISGENKERYPFKIDITNSLTPNIYLADVIVDLAEWIYMTVDRTVIMNYRRKYLWEDSCYSSIDKDQWYITSDWRKTDGYSDTFIVETTGDTKIASWGALNSIFDFGTGNYYGDGQSLVKHYTGDILICDNYTLLPLNAYYAPKKEWKWNFRQHTPLGNYRCPNREFRVGRVDSLATQYIEEFNTKNNGMTSIWFIGPYKYKSESIHNQPLLLINGYYNSLRIPVCVDILDKDNLSKDAVEKEKSSNEIRQNFQKYVSYINRNIYTKIPLNTNNEIYLLENVNTARSDNGNLYSQIELKYSLLPTISGNDTINLISYSGISEKHNFTIEPLYKTFEFTITNELTYDNSLSSKLKTIEQIINSNKPDEEYFKDVQGNMYKVYTDGEDEVVGINNGQTFITAGINLSFIADQLKYDSTKGFYIEISELPDDKYLLNKPLPSGMYHEYVGFYRDKDVTQLESAAGGYVALPRIYFGIYKKLLPDSEWTNFENIWNCVSIHSGHVRE